MAAKETVSVAPMHFIFVHRYLDNRDNRPSNDQTPSRQIHLDDTLNVLPFWQKLIIVHEINLCQKSYNFEILNSPISFFHWYHAT